MTMQGWKLVPVMPTEEMRKAGCEAFSFDVDNIYSSMLAAAPVAPQAEADEGSAAIRTLQGQGYTYHGAQLWKPPLGKKPDFDLIDTLLAQLAERDALLNAEYDENSKFREAFRDIKNWMECSQSRDVLSRIINEALSASAEPAAVSQKSEGV